jgi:HEAT repeat protein
MKKVLVVIAIFIFMWLFWYTLAAQAQINPSRIFVCSEVLMALGKIRGDPEIKNTLIKGLADKEFFIRAYAAEALGYLNDKDAIPMLKNLTEDDNYFVRIIATTALLRLEGIGEDALLNFLKDKKPEIRGNAVEQLGTFGNRYLSNIFEVLLKDDSDFVRTKALVALGGNKFNQAADYSVQVLEDKNPQVRQAACFALGQIGYTKAVPQLNKRLNDKDVKVRASAKDALILLGDQSIINLLWQDIKAKDEFLRGSSYVALANLKKIEVLPVALKEIVAPENSTFVRMQAARALMILKPYVSELLDKALVRLKIDVLSSENLEISFSYRVNGESLTSILISAVTDSKNSLHKDAPFIIRELREKACLPALRQALFLDDPDMVAAAAFTLGELRDKDAVKYLIEVCKKYGCG